MVNRTIRMTEQQVAGVEAEGTLDQRAFSAMVRIAVDHMLGIRPGCLL